ncbi:polycystin-1-like protein 3 isoform X2 [Ptychodera flava]|uniref:polycystin-1-like protein 3 isoform X2 n=1 Tax=Ptychodera flava TaxID=63121 RepID=UPI00396A14C2
MHTIELTWSLPSVSDNSGSVSLFVSHESGSNFSIGVTTVSYIAEDPSGNTAYCWFSVAVKAVARPLFDDTNATRMNISTSELKDLNISAEETGLLAQDILQSMNKAIEVFKNTSEHDINDQDMDLLTKSVLRTTDDLAKFVLCNIEAGSGHVLETSAIRLNVDFDSAEKLTNTSVEMGDGHTFRLPEMQNLFLNWTSRQPIGRIVKRLLRRSFRHDDNANVYDVLSMSFTDGELNDLEVNGTEEDISITFAGDYQAFETPVVVEGVYLEYDDVTYFGMDVNITHLFHAVIINLESPHAVYGITEAYIFNDMVEYSSNYSGYQFSVDAQFDGGNSSIFIPENYIFKAERYYLTFTVPQKQDVKFSMSVKHVVCDYLNEESGTWKNDGCKVSPESNMTSTVCLCNHLTTFKTNIEID